MSTTAIPGHDVVVAPAAARRVTDKST